jgi:hypothetical protein
MTVATAEAQVPQITSLSAGELTRSGRLRIFGENFGTANGSSQVLIDGYPAIVSRWSDVQVTAYVPEDAGPGGTTVQVITTAGASNPIPLSVVLRQPEGRVLWTFEADVLDLWFRPALAPDGTIYLHGSDGFVFALSPDGGLKWIHKANWYPYVPPEAGSGGEVYVGSIQTVTAVNPDGSERWQFSDNGAQGVSVSAKQGPDGNIYAANDLGLGAYSLSPDGQLRWSNPGSPPLVWHGGTGAEMVFGPSSPGGPVDQMYVVMNPQAQSWLQAFRLIDGALQFAIPTGGDDPVTQNQTQPAVGPDGTIYVTHLIGLGGVGWTLEAFHPANGQSLWRYNAWNTSAFSAPDVAPDGVVYYVTSGSRLVSYDPATQTERWNRYDGTILRYPTASPNNDVVVLGGAFGYGQQGFVRAYTVDGDLQWEVLLPGTSLPRWWIAHRPRFSADGRTVYVSTSMLDTNPSDPHAFFLAISQEVVGQPPVVSDIPDQTIAAGGRFLPIRADNIVADPDDPDTDITWSWSGNVALRISWDAARRGIRIRAPRNWTGSETVTFTATDPGGLSDSDQATYTVTSSLAGAGLDRGGEEGDVPAETTLEGNYPNPFNPVTTIRYGLSESSRVSLAVYNVLGERIAVLVDGQQEKGYHEVIFDARLLPSGVYFCRLDTGTHSEFRKLILAK